MKKNMMLATFVVIALMLATFSSVAITLTDDNEGFSAAGSGEDGISFESSTLTVMQGRTASIAIDVGSYISGEIGYLSYNTAVAEVTGISIKNGVSRDEVIISGYAIGTAQIYIYVVGAEEINDLCTVTVIEYSGIHTDTYYFFIKFVEGSTAGAIGITEKEARDGFWAVGYGDNAASALKNACVTNGWQVSFIDEYYEGWIDKFMNLDTFYHDDGSYTYWAQYHWDGEIWAYNQFALGYLDTLDYQYIAMLYSTTDTMEDLPADIDVTPADIPEYLLGGLVPSVVEITTMPSKTVYKIGDTLDLDGIVVEVTYSNGTSAEVTSFTATPAGGTVLDTAGTITVTIAYTENDITKETTFEVTVDPISVTLESIEITNSPRSLYTIGDALDLNGLVVTAHYSDGSSKDVTASISVTPSAGTILNVGTTMVTVSYEEDGIIRTVTFEVVAEAASVSSYDIEITSPPSKTIYEVGDILDLNGLVVTAHYSDGSSVDVTALITASPSSGSVLNTVGTITVTVSYTEAGITKTATFEVIVGAVSVVPSGNAVSVELIFYGEEYENASVTMYIMFENGASMKIVTKLSYDGSTASLTLIFYGNSIVTSYTVSVHG